MYDLVVLGGGIVGIWTALRAKSAGLRVAVVEKGPREIGEQGPASPELRFPLRENIGATKARNHVLTGNSAYWGGGLVRNPDQVLREMFGDEDGAGIAAEYEEVERALGVQPPGARAGVGSADPLAVTEIVVLPGRRRSLWSGFGKTRETSSAQISQVVDATVSRVDFAGDGRMEAVRVSGSSGRTEVLEARNFALAMGVVDSVLFVQEFVQGVLDGERREAVGRHLHDHWSVPVASLTWKNRSPLRALFPPTFGRGGIIGRRLETDYGFFHLVVDYDQMLPYSGVKKYLAARQQGRGLLGALRAGAEALQRPDLLVAAGITFLASRQLRVPDGEEVRLLLDFESCGDRENRIELTPKGADLHWAVRESDRERFVETVARARSSLETVLSRSGLEWSWLFDPSSRRSMHEHLEGRAVDAYHLGGGLQWFPSSGGVTDRTGNVNGVRNLFVNGTAAFCRPGVANPVLTLLARASRYVDTLAAAASRRQTSDLSAPEGLSPRNDEDCIVEDRDRPNRLAGCA